MNGMSVFYLLLGAFVLWRVYRFLRPKRPAVFTPRKQWALTLAQPMVDATSMTGFFNPASDHMTDAARALFRVQLLHQMEFRANATDDEVRQHLAQVFESRWFRADLHALLPTDDPRAALAFACVRMAFFARTVMLMGWVEPMAAWRVLLLNAQRAQDCFASWEDFGHAFIAGRQQWLAAFRADPLGKAFDAASLRQLLAPPKGPWAALAWPDLPAFSPEPR